MKNRWLLLLCCAGLTLGGCGESPPSAGSDLTLAWEVLRNHAEGRFDAELTLTNRGRTALPAGGWSLYFNSISVVEPQEPPGSIRISRVNGDFYRLDPAQGFQPLPPGESVSWTLTLPGWSVSESDAPRGAYLVYRDGAGAEQAPEPLPPVFVRPFVTAEQTSRTPADRVEVPTPAGRYRQNAQLTLLEPGEFSPVVPTPVRLERGEGEWRLDGAVQIHHAAELESEAGYLTESLEPLLGKSLELEAGGSGGPRAVLLRTGRVSAGEAEAYRLTVDAARGVEIVGSDAAGVFYGIQTLRGWIFPSAYAAAEESLSVPAVRVEDAPRFAYRGQHLDVARNFQPKTTVLKLLDLMAFYKLNRFHIHLTDDEGWRWEVRELPELTEVGGRRGHTADERDRLIPSYGSGPFPDPNLSSGSGWYTRQNMVEILRHARRRHIQVIPEIDVPGHARAAIRATEARAARLEAAGDLEGAEEFRLVDPEDESEYRSIQGFDDNVVDPCRESTYRFLGTVFDELIALYREAEAPLRVVHIGGDEVPEGVWEGSPSCRALTEEGESDLPAYFLRRVSRLLAERGLVTGGWEEIGLAGGEGESDKSPNLEFAGEGFQVWVWNSIWGTRGAENAYRLANAGYPVVLSNAASLYLDMAYEKDPREPGQAWAGYVDTRKLFEFTPLDIYQSGRSDFMGRPIDPASLRNATRLTAEGRRNVLGIQGQLWAEVLHTPQRMEYMAFPKLLGLAERAWAAQPDWARLAEGRERERALALAWNRFANTLGQRELWRLDYLYGGVEYRLPPPGVVEEGGEVEVNVGFPGLEVKVEGREAVVVSRTGRRGRRSVLE